MGASSKHKKEKKKDFQKPKLKVGKAKAKPENFTDTSFKSKGITLTQQSLSLTAPSATSQFTHHLGLLNSKSDSQRRDSLSHLTTTLTSQPTHLPPPLPTSLILPHLLPLILDSNSAVRGNLLKLLKALPENDLPDHIPTLLPFLRAGMTHLASDVRVSAVDVLGYILSIAGEEIVSAAGGWVKTLNCFLSVLGWHVRPDSKWTSLSVTGSNPVASSGPGRGEGGATLPGLTPSNPVKKGASAAGAGAGSGSGSGSGSAKASFGKAGVKGRPQVRFLAVLADFLDAGIGSSSDLSSPSSSPTSPSDATFPITTFSSHLLPTQIANPYITLNLFGSPRDEEGEMYETREDRWRVFCSRGFLSAVERGVEGARGEGGEVGRVSSGVSRVLSMARGGDFGEEDD